MLDQITNIVVGAATLWLLYRQNQIFQRQNEIFAHQESKEKELQLPIYFTRVKRYWPMMAMVALTLLLWAGLGFGYYERHHPPPLSEFDAPQTELNQGYGLDTPTTCWQEVNGNILIPYQSDYKVATACFIYDGNEPVLDAPNIQVSDLYDITDGPIQIRQKFSDEYMRYRADKHLGGINVAIILIPNGVGRDDFKTLRQARKLKVLIPAINSANGGSVVAPPAVEVTKPL